MNTTLTRISEVAGRGVPVRGNDIDTDRIIPARFMKCVTFDGLGAYAFYDERFDAHRSPKPHPFNDDRFADGDILIVNSNFGCGSSREHAPQALMHFGIRALVGESFADIFRGNCTAMGIPTVTLAHADAVALQNVVAANPDTEISIDLKRKIVWAGDRKFPADIPEAFRKSLVSGEWDTTAVLMAGADAVEATAGCIPYMHQFLQDDDRA